VIASVNSGIHLGGGGENTIKEKIYFEKSARIQSEFCPTNFFVFLENFFFPEKTANFFGIYTFFKLKFRLIKKNYWKKSPNFGYHKIEMKNPVFGQG
jgi:hypothetical protein